MQSEFAAKSRLGLDFSLKIQILHLVRTAGAKRLFSRGFQSLEIRIPVGDPTDVVSFPLISTR